MNKKFALKVLLLCTVSGLALAAPAAMPEELRNISTGVTGYMDGICYLVGTGSGVVGVWKFVETQSLKVAAIAASVAILAFKFPAWVIAAAVI